MPTKILGPKEKQLLKKLGNKVAKIITEEYGYESLEAFAIEHYDLVATKTLYDLCQGKRNLKLTTLMGLATALGRTPSELLEGLTTETIEKK